MEQRWTYGGRCDWGATTVGGDCPVQQPKPLGLELISKDFTTEHARFHSMRRFDHLRSVFRTQSEASSYDALALTDQDLVDADVELAMGSANGWYVRYPAEAERTASGSGILAGCVLWNTLTPDPTAGACGSGAVGDFAHLYRAHYATGSKLCGNSASTAPARSSMRRSIVPPPSPTPVVSINPVSGAVRYSMMSIEPGAVPTQETLGQGDLAGLLYWLEVPRAVHECRHDFGVCR